MIGLIPAHAFDLMQAWQAAKAFNKQFSSAQATLQAGKEKSIQGRALLLPQLGVNADYSYSDQNKSQNAGSNNSSSYGLQLQQPLFDVSKYTGFQKGNLLTEQAKTQFETTEQQLMLAMAQSYFAVLLAQDNLATAKASKETFMQQLEQAKAAFEVGTATIVDTDEARANYDAALAQEISAVNSLTVAQNTLKRMTGLDPLTIQPVVKKLPLSNPHPDNLEAWFELALKHNPGIRMAQQNVALAKQDVIQKKGQQWPTVSLTAGYTHTNARDQEEVNANQNYYHKSAGIQLSMPLFAGGGIRSQIREVLALEQASKDQLEESKRQTKEAVASAFLGVTNGASLVKAQQQLLKSAKSKVESTRLGKEVGVRTNLDLLQAEQGYYTALTSLAAAKYNYIMAQLQLYLAVGNLDESLLQQINQLIDSNRSS